MNTRPASKASGTESPYAGTGSAGMARSTTHYCGEPGDPVDVALCGDCWDYEDENHALRTYRAAPDRRAPRDSIPFHAWRGEALSDASARRQLWREHHQHSTRWLRAQLVMHEFHLSDYCRPYRSEHLRTVSRWYVRLITTELRHRGGSPS